MSQHDASAQIRQAMRDGNTAEAINMFLQTGAKEALFLSVTFCEAQKKHACNLIEIDEWGRIQAQIYSGILETDCMRETDMPQSIPSKIRANILQLLRQHKTEQALTLCVGLGDQYLLLQAQMNAAKNQSDKGLIQFEYYEATKSRLNDYLEAMLELTVPPSPEGLLNKILRHFR